MRIILYILSLVLALTMIAPALAAPRAASDGSLLLEGDSRKAASSGDTLHELLAQEVQVYIFTSKSRGWPQVYPLRSGSRPLKAIANPQLEALILKYANRHGVDPSLIRAVMRHESGFNTSAVSPKGAQGLMQLMPGTAALMGVNNPFDPEQNIAGGVGYLRRCLDRFQHNVPLAVAAYNAGPESVARYGCIPPYGETQAFVQNVLGSYAGQYPWGASTAPKNPQAPPVKGAKNITKPAKKTSAKVKSPDDSSPRRPKAKIIEVRPAKKPLRMARTGKEN